ncbi:hypothetical protein [Nostoc sp.]|uniref:hypothetical protein n=1 Tax=Nostoc sp. TaxID=1180 RepID=UPI002FF4D8BC
MNFNPSLGSFLLAFLGAVSGWVIWWISRGKETTRQAVASAENALNARRDFNHLIRNLLLISNNIAYGFKDIENKMGEQNNEIREIKAYLIQNRNATHKDS